MDESLIALFTPLANLVRLILHSHNVRSHEIAVVIFIYLKYLLAKRGVDQIVQHGFNEENCKVRILTALSLAALAEAASPHGLENFDSVLQSL
ncbi:hypothetical protein CK203_061003 [Vitis vinifera]|uniref:Uncharacterized protein n=1 Tax=Vitis vinifera TaxID=29760 RepID=A0A438G6P3_VITVI|nr:hypothetical protein CK203_061003 [Vitis vinifera]